MSRLDTDDLEAAWAFTTPRRPTSTSGYDAVMRVARWRWVLVPMVVLVAGCQPSAGQVPPDFTRTVDFFGGSFTASAPTNGTLPASEVMAIYLGDIVEPPDFMLTRPMGDPVFGILSCNDGDDCQFAEPGIPRAVWVVPYWAPLG